VTLNKLTGEITLNSAALAGGNDCHVRSQQ
jgi:hypothetical protein